MQPPAGDKPVGTRSLVEQIVAEQKEQKAAVADAIGRSEKRTKLGPIFAGVLIAANVVAWAVFPPTGDKRGDRRKPLEIDRDVRLWIASAASQVDIYRRTHDGKLPPALLDAGVRDTVLKFAHIDSVTYEIRGKDREVELKYRSNMTLTDFLDGGIGGGPKK